MEQLSAIAHGATEIAQRVGALLMEGFRSDPEVRAKGDYHDVVTEFDERAESELRSALGRLTPEATVVGEEQGGEPDSEWVWYVDPIDGTANFAHGHPFFSLSLGLWRGAEPQFGLVHAPAMHLTYSALKGQGTTRNGQPCRVSTTASLDRALLATGFPHDRAHNPKNNYREFTTLDSATQGVRRCASAALELCLVADGAYDSFWDLGLAPWDIAAGVLLVREAGGKVSNLAGGPLEMNDSIAIIASNSVLHRPVLDALTHARALPPVVEVT